MAEFTLRSGGLLIIHADGVSGVHETSGDSFARIISRRGGYEWKVREQKGEILRRLAADNGKGWKYDPRS